MSRPEFHDRSPEHQPATGHDPAPQPGQQPSPDHEGHPGFGPAPGYGPAPGGPPPAGPWSGGPWAGGAWPGGPDVRMPGIAAAAAVLGFVEAGLGLVALLYYVSVIAAFGLGGDVVWVSLFSAATVVLSALLLLGSLFLVRGSGRRLLLGTTVAEIVLVVGLGIWGLVETSSASDGIDYYADYGVSSVTVTSTTLLPFVLGLVLPVVRLSLAVSAPSARGWPRGPRHVGPLRRSGRRRPPPGCPPDTAPRA